MLPSKIPFHRLRNQSLDRHTRVIVIPPRTSSAITSLTRRIRKAVVTWMVQYLVEYRPRVDKRRIDARLRLGPVYKPSQSAVEKVDELQLLGDGVSRVGENLRCAVDC